MDGMEWKAFVSDVTNKMKELLLFCTLYVTWLPGPRRYNASLALRLVQLGR
jgi:hypothetical protein